MSPATAGEETIGPLPELVQITALVARSRAATDPSMLAVYTSGLCKRALNATAGDADEPLSPEPVEPLSPEPVEPAPDLVSVPAFLFPSPPALPDPADPSDPLDVDPPSVAALLPPSASDEDALVDGDRDVELRSFFAQPDPLKWIVGAVNALRTGAAPQTGQLAGPSAVTEWMTSNRWPFGQR